VNYSFCSAGLEIRAERGFIGKYSITPIMPELQLVFKKLPMGAVKYVVSRLWMGWLQVFFGIKMNP
jgi:hypothetical protein